MTQNKSVHSEHFHFPRIGQRIVKTTVAVFLCLLFYSFRGYSGRGMPTEAAITAILCMQPYVRSSRDYALSRFAGTLLGAGWGLLFLLLMLLFPALGTSPLLIYGLMALGVMLCLYSAVLLRRPDISGLAAIVFICVVIAFPEINQPLLQALKRITGVLVGTACAIAVNLFRLPRVKRRDQVFFVRTRDLSPDRFSHIPAAALFRLNYLYADGAKICLMSEHAPAFFAMEMHDAMLSVPMIVMDGAALYDAKENEYLCTHTLSPAAVGFLRAALDGMGLSYFIYTVHHGRTCIFHQGELREEERQILERMRRSPYRSYLEGEILDSAEIVYLKVIDRDDAIEPLEKRLHYALQGHGLRMVSRPQSVPGVSGLYFYAEDATPENARAGLMERLREKEPELREVEVFSPVPYRTEADAMHVLYRIGRLYEPLWLFAGKRDQQAP